MDARTVLANVREVSARFAAERRERQQRRALVAADFAQLREAGFPLAGVPVDHGGIWESVRRSTRPVCELLRTLAHGDSSVALVCAMHPTVLVFWMATPQVPAPFQAAWDAQRRRIFQPVREGAWWGTVSFEPGSGGDLAKTQAVARPGPMDGVYRLSGQKSFGSGSGVTSYMITTALPEGESAPDVFVLDVRQVAWDGAAGVTLTAPWEGHGMAARPSQPPLITTASRTPQNSAPPHGRGACSIPTSTTEQPTTAFTSKTMSRIRGWSRSRRSRPTATSCHRIPINWLRVLSIGLTSYNI